MRRFSAAIANIFLLTAIVPMGLAGQVAAPSHLSRPHEPAPNLGALKAKLIAYHDCTAPSIGCYITDVDRQSNVAFAYLQRRMAHVGTDAKLAVVFDIDETALSNWDQEKDHDFGYVAKDWDGWIDSRRAPAIAGTLRVYQEAMRRGASVFFITGRPESQREATADNLRNSGYAKWQGLALRGSHPKGQSVTEYKSGERRKILDAGYRIVLNVGDQISDLNGPAQAEKSVKLPNPFYFIP